MIKKEIECCFNTTTDDMREMRELEKIISGFAKSLQGPMIFFRHSRIDKKKQKIHFFFHAYMYDISHVGEALHMVMQSFSLKAYSLPYNGILAVLSDIFIRGCDND